MTRVALADVSGHGRAVAALSDKLHELMQTYLEALEQTALMRDLNEAVRTELDGVHYATMVALGFHGRRGLLVLTNAGHPPPLCYRARRNEWAWLERTREAARVALEGVPLGLLPGVSYDRVVVKPEIGDLLLLYSDGVSEATNDADEELGRDGLLAMVQHADTRTAAACGRWLAAALHQFRAGSVPQDDETMIVLQRRGDTG